MHIVGRGCKFVWWGTTTTRRKLTKHGLKVSKSMSSYRKNDKKNKINIVLTGLEDRSSIHSAPFPERASVPSVEEPDEKNYFGIVWTTGFY